MAAAHEVWARAAWAVVDLCGELDVPSATLFDGLPFDAHSLRRKKRIAWSDYCVLVERLGTAAGGSDELADFLAASYHQVLPELRAVAAALVSPKAFLRFVVDVLDPMIFPSVEFRVEDLEDGCVRVLQRCRAGAQPCETWFRGGTGALRGVTAHLGLPLAEVLERDLGPSHGVYDVRLPESRTLVHRARGAASRWVSRFVIGAESDGTPLAMTVGPGDLDPRAARLDQATVEWKLTPRQAQVLELLASGKANKEIAGALECADNTVELHVTRLLRKARVTSRGELIARFWSETWESPP